ncbi:hypothetical protein CSUI_009051 [Cystoisospora suis]|uniref:Transmembrane protein n=1 Tax=Cystoisospora suis TaxID=483139 RepID=A0A2C6KL64_9APIC|nr:hypothetical protein CSUI_009051 [Cystoisospora suis]
MKETRNSPRRLRLRFLALCSLVAAAVVAAATALPKNPAPPAASALPRRDGAQVATEKVCGRACWVRRGAVLSAVSVALLLGARIWRSPGLAGEGLPGEITAEVFSKALSPASQEGTRAQDPELPGRLVGGALLSALGVGLGRWLLGRLDSGETEDAATGVVAEGSRQTGDQGQETAVRHEDGSHVTGSPETSDTLPISPGAGDGGEAQGAEQERDSPMVGSPATSGQLPTSPGAGDGGEAQGAEQQGDSPVSGSPETSDPVTSRPSTGEEPAAASEASEERGEGRAEEDAVRAGGLTIPELIAAVTEAVEGRTTEDALSKLQSYVTDAIDKTSKPKAQLMAARLLAILARSRIQELGLEVLAAKGRLRRVGSSAAADVTPERVQNWLSALGNLRAMCREANVLAADASGVVLGKAPLAKAYFLAEEQAFDARVDIIEADVRSAAAVLFSEGLYAGGEPPKLQSGELSQEELDKLLAKRRESEARALKIGAALEQEILLPLVPLTMFSRSHSKTLMLPGETLLRTATGPQ